MKKLLVVVLVASILQTRKIRHHDFVAQTVAMAIGGQIANEIIKGYAPASLQSTLKTLAAAEQYLKGVGRSIGKKLVSVMKGNSKNNTQSEAATQMDQSKQKNVESSEPKTATSIDTPKGNLKLPADIFQGNQAIKWNKLKEWLEYRYGKMKQGIAVMMSAHNDVLNHSMMKNSHRLFKLQ